MQSSRNQCPGFTKQGERCRMPVVYKGTFCRYHGKKSKTSPNPQVQPTVRHEEQPKSDNPFSLVYRFHVGKNIFLFVVNVKNRTIESIFSHRGKLYNPKKLLELYRDEMRKSDLPFDQVVTIGTPTDVQVVKGYQKYQLKQIPFHVFTNTKAPPTEDRYSVVYKLTSDDDLDLDYSIVLNINYDNVVESIYDDIGTILSFEDVVNEFPKTYTFHKPSNDDLKVLKSHTKYVIRYTPFSSLQSKLRNTDSLLDELSDGLHTF